MNLTSILLSYSRRPTMYSVLLEEFDFEFEQEPRLNILLAHHGDQELLCCRSRRSPQGEILHHW